MNINSPVGVFQVIDSFAIRSRKQFYLIGEMLNGEVKIGWFIKVGLNSSLCITIPITTIEEIEMGSESEKKLLLIANCDEDAIDFYMAMNLSLEKVPVIMTE